MGGGLHSGTRRLFIILVGGYLANRLLVKWDQGEKFPA